MSDAEIWAAAETERREQVSLYSSLSEQQWSAPSLCAGWRVRDVLAHTTMAYRYSQPRIFVEIVKARGSFNRMADSFARRDGDELSSAQLVDSLEQNTGHRWTPPGGGPLGALSHDVIHGLDVSVALGLDRQVSPERVGTVLRGVRPRQVRYFGVDLTGVQLQATDDDWSYGDGDPVRGRSQELLLVMCGRQVPAGRLTGDAAARFATARA